RVLALDEPLSNLDPSLRERTRRELRQLVKRIGITAGFVTHEQEEAFDLGDRVAVLQAGRAGAGGTPQDPREAPRALFVGTFVGRSNVLRGAAARTLGAGAGEVVLVRPEQLRFGANGLRGVVAERRYTGSTAFFTVAIESGERIEVEAPPDAARVGDRVSLDSGRTLRFPETDV